MTDALRDRVAQALEAAKLQGLGNTAQADAALAEVAEYRRERVAEFEAAVKEYADALYAVTEEGAVFDDAHDAMTALRDLWLEG